MKEPSVPANDDEKLGPGRIAATIVLAVLALVCFGVTGKYLISAQHHSVRVVGSFILGIAFMIGAWFALRYQSLAAEEAREAERTPATQALATDVAPEAAIADDTAADDAATGDAVTADAVGAGPQATAATQA